jgi:hypothetical protein
VTWPGSAVPGRDSDSKGTVSQRSRAGLFTAAASRLGYDNAHFITLAAERRNYLASA